MAVVSTLDASFGRLQGCSGQDANHGHSHLLAFGGNNQSGPIDVATARNACASASGRMDFESETFLVQPTHTLRGEGFDASEDVFGALGSSSPQAQAIAFSGRARGDDGRGYGRAPQVFSGAVGALDTVKPHCVAFSTAMQVRRLTPRECERLQGFPDDYTLIPWRKKPADQCPDGPRYKALGNSWAVPNVAWIGRRIQAEIVRANLADMAIRRAA